MSDKVSIYGGKIDVKETPQDGQILIGDGSSFDLAVLTEGANISIVNTSGRIEIGATGLTTGTVTSVGLTSTGTGLTVSGSPVTSKCCGNHIPRRVFSKLDKDCIMKTSKKGIDLISGFEGDRLTAYKCPAGVWTIGKGHTSAAGSPTVREGMVITQKESDDIFARDLIPYEMSVTSALKVSISQSQFDALVSLCYNIGPDAFRRSSVLRHVNSREWDKVPADFMKWTRGGGRELPGLVRRRRAEVAMWRMVDEQSPVSEDARTKPDEPKPAKTMARSREGNGAIVAGASGAAAVIAEVAPAVQNGADIYTTLTGVIGKPAVIAMVVIIAVSVAIWFWRRQRLNEDGV